MAEAFRYTEPLSSDPNDPAARLLAARARADAAYLRHATHPNYAGVDVAFERLWGQWLEGKCALAESNPTYGAALLGSPSPVAVGVGLPLLPAAVRWAVDEAAPGTVSLTVDVAGGVGVSVTPPSGPAFTPAVTTAPTRATTTFNAAVDGLYLVTLTAGGSVVARLYVPVTRREFSLLREDSRHQRHQFSHTTTPRLTPQMRLRLALLRGAECAAHSGLPDLAASLLARVRALGSYTPAIYPAPRP